MAAYLMPDVSPGIVWHPRTGPWLYVRVPTVHYDGLNDTERIRLLDATRAVLGATGRGEMHLLVTQAPLELDTMGRSTEPAWQSYASEVAAWVNEVGYTRRVCYLGVRLNRSQVWSATRALMGVGRVLGLTADTSGALTDRHEYQDQADSIVRGMAQYGLPVLPATEVELRRLCARPFWLSLDRGAEATKDSLVERSWWNAIVAPATGERLYATSLVVERAELRPFPGGEWLMPTGDSDLDPDISVRMVVMPAAEQAKLLDKARDAIKDQRANMGDRAEHDLALAEQYESVVELAARVRQERQPWVWPAITLTLTGPSPEAVKAKVDRLVPEYEGRGISLRRPPAEQMALLREQAPGEATRVRSWVRRMTTTALAGGMPHAGVVLGDDHGPYVGHTTRVTRVPVQFDPLTLASDNRSPVVAITGQPGTGKSVDLKSMVYDALLKRVMVLYLDPAGETDGLIRLVTGVVAVNLVALDERYAGALDPYRVWSSDLSSAALLAVDLARLMLPAVTGEVEMALTAAADATAGEDAPSMGLFVDNLERMEGGANAAKTLRALSRMKLGQLVFGTGGATIDMAAALTVIRYTGLDLAPIGVEPKDWTVSNRLSAAVLHASAGLTARFMSSDGALGKAARRRKLLVADEAHQLTRSNSGRGLFQRLALTIRKEAGAMIISTQNAEHLGDKATLSTVSVVLAHRAGSEDEARAVAALLLRPDSEDIVDRLANLGTGEFLMRDRHGRVGQVKRDVVDANLMEAVDTTPAEPDAA